jgi:hypothetical protein
LDLASWVASVVEIRFALRLMGAPRGFGAVLVIESLLYALRSVAFAVPNAVGVQEAGYLALGAGFGLPPETALALSLLKRGRDLAIGLPALAAYQLIESRRIWRHASPATLAARRPRHSLRPATSPNRRGPDGLPFGSIHADIKRLPESEMVASTALTTRRPMPHGPRQSDGAVSDPRRGRRSAPLAISIRRHCFRRAPGGLCIGLPGSADGGAASCC